MAAPISTLRSVCPDCGSPFDRGDQDAAQCEECRPARDVTVAAVMHEDRRGSRHRRGYGAAWTRLSRRARRAQPWCSDCGREDRLTTDHSPRAWARHDAGLPIRLRDVDVVCVECNSARGPARGDGAVDRPTMGDELDMLDDLADDMDAAPDDLDQRVARGELDAP